MPEGSCRFQTGSVYCAVLADGYASQPVSWLFPNAAPQQLRDALAARRLPTEHVLSPYTCLLLETGGRVILVDAGAGEASRTAGAIIARLEMQGIRPKNVDTVLVTHAHPEHIGGAVDARGRPAFPNARILMADTELDFWSARRPDLSGSRVPDPVQEEMRETARRCITALRHQIEPLWKEMEIAPGVVAIPSPGHTPGHLALLVSSNGEQLLHVGDAAAHPLHVEEPEWENGFDASRAEALATRRALLERAAAGNARLMAFHFPFPSVGRLAPKPGGGWVWTPGW
jgi:glyoxylase-like metal-dependent hydrolase (beta-lactamase superfamily II)